MKNMKTALVALLCMVLVISGIPVEALATNDEAVVAVIIVGDTKQEFTDLTQALTVSASFALPAYLVDDYTFKAGESIPKDATLIIPTSDAYNDTENGNNDKGAVNPVGAYITAFVPENVNLVIEGTLIVAGNQQGGIPRTGFLTGQYGALQLDGTMTVNGTLYARGSVYGSGSVEIPSGGNVFQRFEIADWRGGSASLRAYTLQGVYPFNLYEANGLDVTATYHSGATLTGQSYIYSDQKGTGAISTIQMLGSDGLITFDDPNASVTFKHDAAGVSTAEVTGKVKTGDITVKVETQFGIDVPLTSSFGIGPFGYKQNVILKKGATFNVTNQLKILPGCTITVEPDATMNVEKGMYFYTAGSYDRSWNNAGWPPANSGIDSATLVVEEGGHVTGTVGSTAGNFSNITGLGELTATGKATVKEVTQSGTSVSPVEVTFQTVNLSVTATPAE